MSTPAAPSTGAGGAQPPREQPNQIWGTIQKVVMFWAISQLATRYLFPKPAAPPPVDLTSPGSSPDAPGAPVAPPANLAAITATPLWPLGTPLSMEVFVTDSPSASNIFGPPARQKMPESLAHLTWDGITWGNWSDVRSWDGEIPLPTTARVNGTLIWAHIFLSANGASPDPYNAKFNPKNVHHIPRPLTKYMPRKKVVKEKKLLSKSEETEPEPEPVIEAVDEGWVPYWYPNVTLTLVSDAGPISPYAIPPILAEHVHFDSLERGHERYYPIVYPNTFWHLSTRWESYSSTNATLPLRIDFHPLSYFKFQLYASLAAGFENAASQQGGGQGGAAGAELDEIKRILIETNPIMLIVTALVTMLHMLFEVLAFTSDVGHWRKKEDRVGVSVRTILTNVFVQTVILLYLIDNNESTSYVIFFSQGTGVLIEAWKVTKVLDINLIPSAPGSLIPYQLDIKDKHVLSEEEKLTQEYDKLAFRYVSWVAIPLLAGYTVYSLVYDSHKGWYSFIISTLTSFVYMFGFAQLVPQLIINYKLKSVAHLPTKTFVYKFLSTIVDDFFSFIVKMPFLHRLACFRDDAVFLVFLYQRWIYRVDPKRVNEYGQVLVDDQTEVGAESKKDK